MRNLTIYLISLYQKYITVLLPSNCRFYPTCSQFAKKVVEKHGCMKGGKMAILRLLKCHPFHPGGYDPVEKYN